MPGPQPINQNTAMHKLSINCLLGLVALGLLGCTSVNVRPVAENEHIKTVYIVRNPKVAVDDFLDVLRDGFARHGIGTEIISNEGDAPGEYIVTYVAWRNWDMAPYLRDAAITIERNGEVVGHAEYHLVGKGGLSPLKWEGTKTKMDPVIDQLLGGETTDKG